MGIARFSRTTCFIKLVRIRRLEMVRLEIQGRRKHAGNLIVVSVNSEQAVGLIIDVHTVESQVMPMSTAGKRRV